MANSGRSHPRPTPKPRREIKDREVTLKLVVKGNPQLPEITDNELARIILSLECIMNSNGNRRFHINMVDENG